jgi:hypothetical protein
LNYEKSRRRRQNQGDQTEEDQEISWPKRDEDPKGLMSAKLTAKPTVGPPLVIAIGGTVTVNDAGVNVRDAPAGNLVGTQASGAIGTVTAGPVNKVLVSGGPNVVWWNVTFKVTPSGWVGADNLIATTPPPSPTPPSYHSWNSILNNEEATNPTPSALLAWINANPPKPD